MGNSYMDYSIKYLSPDGKLHTLIQDSRLLWPDSFDGHVYFLLCPVAARPAVEQWRGYGGVFLHYQIYKVKLP